VNRQLEGGHIMVETRLNDRVLSALKRSPYLAGRNLRFETEHGRITLRGVVHSYFQKQMAQETVRHIEGIHEILNELEVVPDLWAPSRAG
jgi:osmotically-inducible protein OsmY